MRKFLTLMMTISALLSVAACGQPPKPQLQIKATEPCDVLVAIPTRPETNEYLRVNDRPAFVGLARHQGRVAQFGCNLLAD